MGEKYAASKKSPILGVGGPFFTSELCYLKLSGLCFNMIHVIKEITKIKEIAIQTVKLKINRLYQYVLF
jgi:hypothetical protein